MKLLDKNNFSGTMDFDSSDETVKKGDYRKAVNFDNALPSSSDGNRLVAVKSSLDINFPLDNNDVFIGTFCDKLNSVVYTFVFNPLGEFNKIFYTNISDNQPKLLFKGSSLDFTGELLLDAYFLDGFLVYTQEGLEPKMIVVDRALTTFDNQNLTDLQYPEPNNSEHINLICPPPTSPPVVDYIFTSQSASNELRNNLYAFQYRYVYADKRESKYSPISKLLVPQVQLNEYTGSQNYPFNAIKVEMLSGRYDVVSIDIICKINFNDPVVVGNINVDNTVNENQLVSFNFLNDSLYRQEDSRIANQLFDAVPLTAKTMTLANNAIVFSNYKLGYEIPEFKPVRQEISEKIFDDDAVLEFTSETSIRKVTGFTQQQTTTNNDTLIESSDNGRGVRYMLTLPSTLPANYRVYFEMNVGMFNNINYSTRFVFDYITTDITSSDNVRTRIKTAFDNFAVTTLLQDMPNQVVFGGAVFTDTVANPNTNGILMVINTDVNRDWLISAKHISEPFPNAVIPALKSFVTHKFGFTFHDYANRSSFVGGRDNYIFNSLYVDKETIKSSPAFGVPAKAVPSWVKQINLVKNDVQQPTNFITLNCKLADNTSILNEGKALFNVKNIIDFNGRFNSILSYDFTDGDLVRILAERNNSTEEYVSALKKYNTRKVVGVDTTGGNFNVIFRDGGNNFSFANNEDKEYIIQIFRPIKSVAEEEELFYETGVSVNIDNYTGFNTLMTAFRRNPSDNSIEVRLPFSEELSDILQFSSVFVSSNLTNSDELFSTLGSFLITDKISETSTSIVFKTNKTDSQENFPDNFVVNTRNIFLRINSLSKPTHYVFNTKGVGDIYLRKRLAPLSTNNLYIEDNNFSNFFDSKTYMRGRPNKVEDEVLVRRPLDICFGKQYVSQVRYNSLSDFVESDFVDYPQVNFGEIQRILFSNDRVYVMQEANTGYILVRREMILSPQGGQDTLTATTSFFGSDINYYLGDYGLRNRNESVMLDGNNLYFIDSYYKQLIRIGANGAFPISNYKANSYFSKKIKEVSLSNTFRCFITKESVNNQILISFIDTEDSEPIEQIIPYQTPFPSEDFEVIEFDPELLVFETSFTTKGVIFASENSNNQFFSAFSSTFLSPQNLTASNAEGSFPYSYQQFYDLVFQGLASGQPLSGFVGILRFKFINVDSVRYEYSDGDVYFEQPNEDSFIEIIADGINFNIESNGDISVLFDSAQNFSLKHSRVDGTFFENDYSVSPSLFLTTIGLSSGFLQAEAVFFTEAPLKALKRDITLPLYKESEVIAFSEDKNGFTSFYENEGIICGEYGNKAVYYKDDKAYVTKSGEGELEISGVKRDASIKYICNVSPSDVKLYQAISIEGSIRKPKETTITTPNGQLSIIPTEQYDKRENNLYSAIYMDLNTPSETEEGEVIQGALYNGNPIRDRVATFEVVIEAKDEGSSNIHEINTNVSKSNRSNI